MSEAIQKFMEGVAAKNPGSTKFLQAVEEVAESVMPVIEENPIYQKAKILERMVEPERVIIFRVPWVDDAGEIQVNRGYRVQMNSAIGPYKGGLRFHKTVNLDTLKFLAFEQTFKNSLTGIPMGGGKGGSDFDARGKSDGEVMRFCQAFMAELFRHVGPNTDVPAGDLGVGGREIGYMFGMYKKLTTNFIGVITGKGLSYGGSKIRPEATGYGVTYFAEEVLKQHGDSLAGKTCVISGAGNVGLHTIEKVTALGGKVVAMRDYDGTIYDPDGISPEKLAWLKQLVFKRTMPASAKGGFLHHYAEKFPKAQLLPDKKSWAIPCDVAFPTACENELDLNDAQDLIGNGCKYVIEGANMPSTSEAIEAFQAAGVVITPGKAANAGGVATSGLEMAQNAMHLSWEAHEVEEKLHGIMKAIHQNCVEYGRDPKTGKINYVKGANIAGFIKVADAMVAQGVV